MRVVDGVGTCNVCCCIYCRHLLVTTVDAIIFLVLSCLENRIIICLTGKVYDEQFRSVYVCLCVCVCARAGACVCVLASDWRITSLTKVTSYITNLSAHQKQFDLREFKVCCVELSQISSPRQSI